MGLRKKKSLLDQASEYVDSMKPQVESALHTARDSTRDFVETTAVPLLADAKDRAADGLAEARAKAGPALSDAREKAGPAWADAREKAAPYLADAREKAAPYVSDARAKAAPLVASGTALAGEKASAIKELADAKAAQIKGEPEPKKKGGKLKKLFLFTLVAGAAGVIAKRFQDQKTSDNWQSSYVPSPPPSSTTSSAPGSPATPPTPAAPMAGAEDDTAGSSPDEALADAAEAPHPVSTPDQPAEVVDLDAERGKHAE